MAIKLIISFAFASKRDRGTPVGSKKSTFSRQVILHARLRWQAAGWRLAVGTDDRDCRAIPVIYTRRALRRLAFAQTGALFAAQTGIERKRGIDDEMACLARKSDGV